MSGRPRIAALAVGLALAPVGVAKAAEPLQTTEPAEEVVPVPEPAPPPFIRAGGETGHRLHLAVRTAFLYHTFSPALGVSVRPTAYWPVWNTRRATGSIDVGVLLGYAWGGAALYPWLRADPDVRLDGADHNITTAVTLGHAFHLGKRRRSSLGLHAVAGLNVAHSTWTQAWLREGFEGTATTTFPAFTFGPEVDYHFRFSRRVGFDLLIGGTCPCLPSPPAGSLLRVGGGLTVYLR